MGLEYRWSRQTWHSRLNWCRIGSYRQKQSHIGCLLTGHSGVAVWLGYLARLLCNKTGQSSLDSRVCVLRMASCLGTLCRDRQELRRIRKGGFLPLQLVRVRGTSVWHDGGIKVGVSVELPALRLDQSGWLIPRVYPFQGLRSRYKEVETCWLCCNWQGACHYDAWQCRRNLPHGFG